MATATASTYLKPAGALHAGVNTLVGVYTATAVAGDVIKIGRIPDRAAIVGGGLYKAGAGDLLMRTYERTGTSSQTIGISLLSASASGTLATLNPTALGYLVSLSDEVAIKDIDIELVVASASHTGTIKYVLQWTLDHTMK